MKEAIYSWIKCLAIFYILLTMLIHLVPTGKYQRYVRFLWTFADGYADHSHAFHSGKAKTLPESFSSLTSRKKKRLTLDLEKSSESLLEKVWRSSLRKIFRNL